jgi:hypothetical protein
MTASVLRLAPLLLLLGLPGLLLLPSDPSGPSVTGRVTDERGPVEGARVRLQTSRVATLTDRDGRFSLRLPFGVPWRVTSSREGYLIAGADADHRSVALRLEPLPRQDNEEYAWVDPHADPASRHACANCHGEIYREWLGSAHARSVTGRHFLDLYAGRDRTGAKPARADDWSVLGQYPEGSGVCTSCHAPTVAESDPAYYDLRKLRGVAANGIHCDYCHKVAGARGPFGLTHGRFGLTMLRPAHGQLFFGPLDDVDRGEDAHSPLYRDSRYCASCHEGTVFGVHVYGTWSEWRDSPAGRAGKQCQGCHTTPTGRMSNVAPGKGGLPRDPHTLGNHVFFADSREAMLRDGVRLEVETAKGEVVVSLDATRAGHHVPTGFVDRHILLVVEAADADGNPVAATRGARLPPSAGDLAGRSGVLFAKLLSDFDGRTPAPFWLAAPETTDTRLVPSQPQRHSFTFPPTARSVRIRLLYRRFWHAVAVAKGWRDNETVVHDLRRNLP